jgi:hypothetical protein
MGDYPEDRNPPNGTKWDVNELKRWRHDDIDPLKLPSWRSSSPNSAATSKP